MIPIDRLCWQSRLRQEHPGLKFFYSLSTLCICLVSRSPAVALAALAASAFLTVHRGGIPARRYCRLLALPLTFLLLSSAAIAVNLQRTPLDLFALPVGPLFLTGSRAGLWYALRLALTALAGVSCLYFLSLTTPMTDLLDVLRALHCPRLLTELMLMIYRYIFILTDTARTIRTAQDSRLGSRDFRRSLRSFGMLGSALMIRAVTRSRALYEAMEARCYDGTVRVLSEHRPLRRSAAAGVVLFELFLILLAAGGRVYGI